MVHGILGRYLDSLKSLCSGVFFISLSFVRLSEQINKNLYIVLCMAHVHAFEIECACFSLFAHK